MLRLCKISFQLWIGHRVLSVPKQPQKERAIRALRLKASDHAKKVGAFQLERPGQWLGGGDAVDAVFCRQAIALSKAHQASIVLNGEDANDAGNAIQGVKIVAVIAGCYVEVCAARGILANDRVANGSEYAAGYACVDERNGLLAATSAINLRMLDSRATMRR